MISDCADGNFQIPAKTSTGNYFIKAVTQYQRNLSPELFTTQPITIVNPEYSLPDRKQNIDPIGTTIQLSDKSIDDSSKGVEILVQPDKSVYNKRQAVELNVKLSNANTGDLYYLNPCHAFNYVHNCIM